MGKGKKQQKGEAAKNAVSSERQREEEVEQGGEPLFISGGGPCYNVPVAAALGLRTAVRTVLKGPVWLFRILPRILYRKYKKLLAHRIPKLLSFLQRLVNGNMAAIPPPPPIFGDIDVHKKWMRAALEMVRLKPL